MVLACQRYSATLITNRLSISVLNGAYRSARLPRSCFRFGTTDFCSSYYNIMSEGIILSRSKVGLQNCLNTLSSYCNSWMLKINPKKTKIIIFQKCKRKCDSSFYICNEKIDIVQNCTYLGTCISSTGNFPLSLDHLRQKALHALFSLRRNIDFKSLKPSPACKIFDSMNSPTLTYNSKVWGTLAKSGFQILGQLFH